MRYTEFMVWFSFVRRTPYAHPQNIRLMSEHPKNTRLQNARAKPPAHSVDGCFYVNPANGRKQKAVKKALLPRPFDGYRVQKKNGNSDTHRIKITVLRWQMLIILIQCSFAG